MAAFMLMAPIPDILQIPQAVSVFTHLGYPTYLLPFLGIAKTLGVVAILIPAVWRLKEWAYAGLVFDLIGALYSHVSAGDAPSAWVLPIVGLLLVMASYLLHRIDHHSRRPAATGNCAACQAGQIAPRSPTPTA
jgi:DoxX-like family